MTAGVRPSPKAHLRALQRERVVGHLRRMTLKIALYYPEHERRHESAMFRDSRHELIDVRRVGCWICGTRENLECHHMYIEWALANAINWPAFAADWPQFAHYGSVNAFVDSVDNQRILCAHHHRHRNAGIHMLDFPEWEVQRYLNPGYQYQGEI